MGDRRKCQTYTASPAEPGGLPGMLAFGIGAVIGFPDLYGAMGFVFGAVFAWIYNAVSKRVGGIEIETE